LNASIEVVMKEKIKALSAAVEKWQQQDQAVSQAPSAPELEALIDVSLGQQGAKPAQVEQAIDDYLKYSPNTSRPEFFKLLYSGLNQDALLGDWITSLCNSTMHTYQVGPVATLMELELIRQCNALIGFDQGEGVMVAGGSQANLIGMMLARQRAMPNVKTKGFSASAAPILRAYVSDQAHYSFQRAANLLGIGTDNLIKVESDEQGRIRPDNLERAIIQDQEQGFKPFFIGLTAGTTVVGAFDSVAHGSAIANKHGMWLHIDGAWGAPVLFSERHKALLADSGLADSLTWDAHKLMNVPITAALILLKEQGRLKEAIAGGGGDYLFHEDVNAPYNLGEKSIQCGRRADALKVWLSWKALGNQGFADKIDELQTLKSACVKMIQNRSALEIIGPTGYLNVLFRYNADSVHSEAELAELNKSICKLMVARGGPHVDYAQYKGRTGIRLILGNAAASNEHIEDLLNYCERLGAELEAA
jgi:glutamate/tyrosine decarboxylase-like PLP-dependent enzyme